MKKVIFIIAFVASTFTTCAEDFVMWWMVGDDQVDPEIGSYDTAYLYAKTDGSIQMKIGKVTDQDELGFSVPSDPLDSALVKNCSFWVELFSENHLVGSSEVALYEAVSSYFTSYNGGSPSEAPGGTWTPTIQATGDVPEPTSGLLLLFGLAGLALRRRNVA